MSNQDTAEVDATLRGVNAIDTTDSSVPAAKAAFVQAVYATLSEGLGFNPLATAWSDYGYGGDIIEGATELHEGDRYFLALKAWYGLHATVWPDHLVQAEAWSWANGQLNGTTVAAVARDRERLVLLADSVRAEFADEAAYGKDPSEAAAAVAALVVAGEYGGTVVSAVNAGITHAWNLLDDGREVDLLRTDIISWAPGPRRVREVAELLDDSRVQVYYDEVIDTLRS